MEIGLLGLGNLKDCKNNSKVGRVTKCLGEFFTVLHCFYKESEWLK